MSHHSRSRTKDSAAIAAIREVQSATETAMTAVIEYLKTEAAPTAETAHQLIDDVLHAHGCESPEGHIVSAGPANAEPHELGSGVLPRGTSIMIDIFPRSKKTSYFADMTRTVCLGEAPAELKKMYEAVLAAQKLAMKMIKPGAKCLDIHQAVVKYFADAGYRTSGQGIEFPYAEGFVHSVGHGVGIGIHEDPIIGSKSKDTLRIGDVITIEPGLYYHDIGGIRLEDLLVVTKKGHQNLTNFQKVFEI